MALRTLHEDSQRPMKFFAISTDEGSLVHVKKLLRSHEIVAAVDEFEEYVLPRVPSCIENLSDEEHVLFVIKLDEKGRKSRAPKFAVEIANVIKRTDRDQGFVIYVSQNEVLIESSPCEKLKDAVLHLEKKAMLLREDFDLLQRKRLKYYLRYNENSSTTSLEKGNSKDEGCYKGDFIKKPAKDLLCSKCSAVPRKPLQTKCGHLYSKSCLEELEKQPGIAQSFADKKELQKNEYYDDKRTLDRILKLEAKCPMHYVGCDKTFTLKEDEEKCHADACQYVLVDCPNECRQRRPRSKMSKHLSSSCPRRLTRCKYCSFETEFRNINAHYEKDCELFPVPCRHCPRKMTRCKIAFHMENCPEVEIACKYEKFGCQVQEKRKDMAGHLSKAIEEHVLQLGDMVAELRQKADEARELSQENEALRQDYEDLRKKVENLEKDGDKIRAENKNLRCTMVEELKKSTSQLEEMRKEMGKEMDLRRCQDKEESTTKFEKLRHDIEMSTNFTTREIEWKIRSLDQPRSEEIFSEESGQKLFLALYYIKSHGDKAHFELRVVSKSTVPVTLMYVLSWSSSSGQVIQDRKEVTINCFDEQKTLAADVTTKKKGLPGGSRFEPIKVFLKYKFTKNSGVDPSVA